MAGAFGTGNLGNDASLEVVVDAIRHRWPDVPLGVLTYGEPRGPLPHGLTGIPFVEPERIRGPVRIVGTRAGRLAAKVGDVVHMIALLRGTRHVVVPGMGVLESRQGGGPWGFPLALATFAVAARPTRLHLLAVGADPPTDPGVARLFRVTARLADTRSFRSERSRDAVRALGVDTGADPVIPDLAFAFADRAELAAVQPVSHGRIGLGVMRYYGPADDPTSGLPAHEIYNAAIGRLAAGLLDEGLRVTLLVGDAADEQAFGPIRREVVALRGNLDGLTCHVSTTLTDLVEVMSNCEVVIASRYHNVIAAALAGRPVITLGYGPKFHALMDDLGLLDFAHDIDEIDVAIVLDQVGRIRRAEDEVAAHLHVAGRRRTSDVHQHLDSVIATWEDIA